MVSRDSFCASLGEAVMAGGGQESTSYQSNL